MFPATLHEAVQVQPQVREPEVKSDKVRCKYYYYTICMCPSAYAWNHDLISSAAMASFSMDESASGAPSSMAPCFTSSTYTTSSWS